MTSTQKGTLNPGTLVGNGRFKIIKLLGEGTFGQTYLAEDTHDFHRKNALKRFSFVNSNANTFEKAKELFDREAKVLNELTDNPENNLIPKYRGFISENQELYLAQDFIDGVTLHYELQSKKKFNEDETAKLLDDVLNALYFIHSQRIIHRDIKPENLIRRKTDNKIVLIDFGAVKQEVTQLVPTPGTKIHTKGYAPPEQMQGHAKYYSDIYALGMTALEALTGVEPEKLKDAHTEKVVWPSQVQVSDKLKKILEKMVEHNYKRRYQSAEDVLQALKSAGFRSTLVVAPGPPPKSTLLSGVFPMWLRFVLAAPLVAILAFFVALMVPSIFIRHPTQPETPKPGDVKSPTPTHKPSDDQHPPVKRSPKQETPQPKNVQSPTPTPEPSDDDIFKRPPGTP